jgi:hypothetical protein
MVVWSKVDQALVKNRFCLLFGHRKKKKHQKLILELRRQSEKMRSETLFVEG